MNPKLCGLQQDKGSSTNAFMDEGGAQCGRDCATTFHTSLGMPGAFMGHQ